MQYFIQHFLHRIITMPPHILIKKIATKSRNKVKAYYSRKGDQRLPSFALDITMPHQSLNRLFGDLPQDILMCDWDWLNGVTRHYLSHRFDLLGSGWVRVYHGMQCRGLEGYRFDMGSMVTADREGHWLRGRINTANLDESQRIWRLIDAGYCPIDWHLDFKSGYRWREDIWYKDIKYGHLLGVDIKVPWELARMQHLPQLAWAYALAQQKTEDFDVPEKYVREFRNQVLDFISTNPPRWGVNWACTMDVSIRAANWLIAYDLFISFGTHFDVEFAEVLSRSIYEHGQHIIENLEWSTELRSNHYLSNIIGLLFVSVYLPCSSEVNAWLAFSVQELIKEVKNQFYEDGSNFEASTSYHRLSAEMVIYATALVLGLSEEKRQSLKDYDHNIIKGKPELSSAPLPSYSLPNSKDESPFPAWYFTRLERMAEFSMHLTKCNGNIPQIGDNDSGRFLKLFPVFKRMTVGEARSCYHNLMNYDGLSDDNIYWMEDFLTHRHLVAAINGLFVRADFTAFVGDAAGREGGIISALSRGRQVASIHAEGEKTTAQNIQIGDLSGWLRCENLFSKCTSPSVVTRFPSSGVGLRNGLETIAYPDFGLYLIRSKRLYLAVRCGSIGQNGNGGHAHNDQLSIELEIDGNIIVIDSGTYIYTPLPHQRNAYRSVKAHFTPRMQDKEPGDLSVGTFFIGGNPQSKAIYFGEYGFLGMHAGYGIPVYRQITLEEAAVVVTDFCPSGDLTQGAYEKMPFSPAYGVIQNEIEDIYEKID